jgi:hypothetical protein
MLRTSRSIGQLLAQRASGMTTVSNAPTEPVTMAALQFMGDVVRSNTEDRHRMDDKFKGALDKFSSSLDSLKESFSSSQNSLKAEIHSLDKKVTSVIAISSFVASLVTLAGVTIRAGLIDASSTPVVAKTVEALAQLRGIIFGNFFL